MDATHRKFRKSNDRIIAGVCAGIAEWLGWQPIAGRVLFTLISVMSVGVPGVIVYLALAILMPKAEDVAAP